MTTTSQTFLDSGLGSYAGAVADDAGSLWLLYVGAPTEMDMAVPITAASAADTHERFHGTLWLLNFLLTTPDVARTATLSDAFFARLQAHLERVSRGLLEAEGIVSPPNTFQLLEHNESRH